MIFTDEKGRKWKYRGEVRQAYHGEYHMLDNSVVLWKEERPTSACYPIVYPVPVEYRFGNDNTGYVVFEWVLCHCAGEPYTVWQSGPSHVYPILRPVRVETVKHV